MDSLELLAYQRLAETGLSAAELASLSMDEYARITNRPTLGQVAARVEAEPPGKPRQEPTQSAPQPPAPEPQGVDVSSLDMATYAQLRSQLGMGGREYGRGILDGGSTAEWIAAARAKSGRAAMNERGVQQAPQLEGRYVRQNPLDTRSARDRFATPGNAWQG